MCAKDASNQLRRLMFIRAPEAPFKLVRELIIESLRETIQPDTGDNIFSLDTKLLI